MTGSAKSVPQGNVQALGCRVQVIITHSLACTVYFMPPLPDYIESKHQLKVSTDFFVRTFASLIIKTLTSEKPIGWWYFLPPVHSVFSIIIFLL